MHIDAHADTYMYKLAYAQPSSYINTYVNSNMHSHILPCTHIYVRTQEHSVPNLLLSFQNMQLIVSVSEKPNPKL